MKTLGHCSLSIVILSTAIQNVRIRNDCNKMTVYSNKMTSDQLSVVKMTVNGMLVDKMMVEEMTEERGA